MNAQLKDLVKKLPDEPGVYQFFGLEGHLIYVGKSISIKKRVMSYFAKNDLGPKTNQLVRNIHNIKYIKAASEFDALLLEADLIRQHQPFYNIEAKDDKSPIYIKITNADVPLIELVRKTNLDVKSRDFTKGPFPSAKTTRRILKSVRKIFAFCHHKNPKTPCLFVHLGLCPYPYSSQEAKLEYKKNIKRIKALLSGKSNQLVRELKSEMRSFANAQKFEEADKVKKQLLELEYLTTNYTDPRDYIERPTLVDDLTTNRLNDLKEKLNLEKIPRRIECFDISNISGKLATGSMVVFVNGRPEKSQYRRFKIKFKNTPDDFEMIRETLSRRFKNTWPDADLIIIDGGKGQLSSATKTAVKYNKNLRIISLAKKLEEIYLPGVPEPIRLPKESPARQLVEALRDEAHRFAITYHRLLRSKAFITS